MTKQEKNKALQMETIAYYSGFGGVEIKAIEYGIEDYVIFIANSFIPNIRTAHRVKIYYNTSRPYFNYHTLQIHLDECIRV